VDGATPTSERGVRCGCIKGLSFQWPQSVENSRLDLPEIRRIKAFVSVRDASTYEPKNSEVDSLRPRISLLRTIGF
jgi:hypothetical protein